MVLVIIISIFLIIIIIIIIIIINPRQFSDSPSTDNPTDDR